jgi:putative endonuclease
MSKKRNKLIGDWGEEIASNYLKRHGFTIIERNYLKKWGEIDIIAEKNDQIHFIEVKSVSHETKKQLFSAVSRVTWRPEEQVTTRKLYQINKAIESWLDENHCESGWQIDICAIRMVPNEKYATLRYLPNIILG